jgi:hypothetical protein
MNNTLNAWNVNNIQILQPIPYTLAAPNKLSLLHSPTLVQRFTVPLPLIWRLNYIVSLLVCLSWHVNTLTDPTDLSRPPVSTPTPFRSMLVPTTIQSRSSACRRLGNKNYAFHRRSVWRSASDEQISRLIKRRHVWVSQGKWKLTVVQLVNQ